MIPHRTDLLHANRVLVAVFSLRVCRDLGNAWMGVVWVTTRRQLRHLRLYFKWTLGHSVEHSLFLSSLSIARSVRNWSSFFRVALGDYRWRLHFHIWNSQVIEWFGDALRWSLRNYWRPMPANSPWRDVHNAEAGAGLGSLLDYAIYGEIEHLNFSVGVEFQFFLNTLMSWVLTCLRILSRHNARMVLRDLAVCLGILIWHQTALFRLILNITELLMNRFDELFVSYLVIQHNWLILTSLLQIKIVTFRLPGALHLRLNRNAHNLPWIMILGALSIGWEIWILDV